ncbi:type II toxin-antitoxin system VapC family toxin [Cyanobacterium aponinum UTEX 3222]|uniref:type II toxin-antitoxin system VapC family toxin n=1 Tax=Cyanobacterium aponinum TaxID=379064 RepID=UPI000C12BC48|nr:type II toxin-antitoxin system VapC family toxin [Cyanobacterium aponinum]MBD2394799.1 type II toxin-antitoxin system VapC family toxin [Cyanobacterium aponinum FACHB-4101]PHV63355.1 PIN domain nuclease [Cyanobacterium aponinum IPPAS B-1201]WRL39929.1 type II toxin-antitoxin system VapC family toxin [Cyanobacterium aponinum UTEX 3221]WRL42772.1 type II toxin-antitoxin system VapC family toxin [Cyanobacterium aponinum UTEX 3222]
MNILLDTHCWLWWLVEPEKLSQTAIATIQNNQNKLYLSVASIWEIGIKYKLGKLDLPISPEILIPQQMQIDKISSLSISVAHALNASILPSYHKDPFDRMLIAQSQLESMTIISNDSMFNSYNVQVLW